jgi:phage tail P2-like protein
MAIEDFGPYLSLHKTQFPPSALYDTVDPDGVVSFFLDPIMEHQGSPYYFDGELESFGWEHIYFGSTNTTGERQAREAQLAGLLDLFSPDRCPERWATGEGMLPYLADNVGWRIYDQDWAAGIYDTAREQIKNAINWYKEKGKPASIEALFRTLGFYVTVDELWINLESGECLSPSELIAEQISRAYTYASVPITVTEYFTATDDPTKQAIIPILPRTWEVRVDGTLWTDVRDHTTINYLSQAGPSDEVYHAALDAEGELTVTFGDGTNGADPGDGAVIEISFLRDYTNQDIRGWQVYYDGNLEGRNDVRRNTYGGSREYGFLYNALASPTATLAESETRLPVQSGTFELRATLTTAGSVKFVDDGSGNLTHATVGITSASIDYTTGAWSITLSGDTFKTGTTYQTHYGDRIKYDRKFYGRKSSLKGWVPHSRIEVVLVQRLVQQAPSYSTLTQQITFIRRRIEDVRPIHVLLLVINIPNYLYSNFSNPSPDEMAPADQQFTWLYPRSIVTRPELWTEPELEVAGTIQKTDNHKTDRYYTGVINYDGNYNYDADRVDDSMDVESGGMEKSDTFDANIVNPLTYSGLIEYNTERGTYYYDGEGSVEGIWDALKVVVESVP